MHRFINRHRTNVDHSTDEQDHDLLEFSFADLLHRSLMTMFLLIVIGLSIVAANAEQLGSQPWTNYFENCAAKIHDYQTAEPGHEKNPFDEGFLLLTNDRKKSPQTNKTLTTTCHTVTSTISTSLAPLPIEETSSNERLRRSLNADDVDFRHLLNIDDDDEGKLLETLLKAGPNVDGSGFSTSDRSIP